MNILGLLCNVATLALNVATLQRRDVSTSRCHFDPPLERRDDGYQRRDVDFNHSLERRDVDIQRRDVDFAPLWNIAMLIFNVATLIITILWNVATLPRTSRRWKTYSLERRDVALFNSK